MLLEHIEKRIVNNVSLFLTHTRKERYEKLRLGFNLHSMRLQWVDKLRRGQANNGALRQLRLQLDPKGYGKEVDDGRTD